MAHYLAVLSSDAPATIPWNQKAKAYEPFISQERRVELHAAVDASDGEVGSEHDIGEVLSGMEEAEAEPEPPVAPPPVAIDALLVDGSSDSSSSSSASSSVAGVISGAEEPELGDYPEFVRVGELYIVLDIHDDPIGPSRSYKRYRDACRDRRHPGNCRKSRSIGLAFEIRHGKLEPLAFCLAWARQAHRWPTRSAHVKYRPTDVEIDAAAAELRAQGWR